MKDKGCVDNVLSIQYKQLFCIIKATVVGDSVTSARGCALICYTEC